MASSAQTGLYRNLSELLNIDGVETSKYNDGMNSQQEINKRMPEII